MDLKGEETMSVPKKQEKYYLQQLWAGFTRNKRRRKASWARPKALSQKHATRGASKNGQWTTREKFKANYIKIIEELLNWFAGAWFVSVVRPLQRDVDLDLKRLF